ncbi:Outer membrane lipoprotein LolB precursor [Candidatus Methylocalor cossyra]|uniref:Outer-membrane lipoprotein LolB n=1 Tax=Candidatus Methylocalor cossyra TaxID=3108543 RepID=A0ABM9NK32_9GAMM
MIALALGAALAGCAPLRPERAAPSLAPERAKSLAALPRWRLEGRIGVQTMEDAWQANLFWDHEPTQDRLRVSGPLGQNMVSIVVQKDLIYVNEGQGVERLSRDPEGLLRERLGFAVPLNSLRYWILGVPDPAASLSGGEGAGFRQSGWTVQVDRLMEVGNHALPQRLRVWGSGVKLKILADHWEIEG